MSHWRWIQFEHAIPHCVPKSLASTIIKDLTNRDCAVEKNAPVTEVSFDMPGMCLQSRPVAVFPFQGLTVHIPCEDISAFHGQVRAAAVRGDDRRPYYKIHAFHRAWVLTPHQRLLLERKLKSLEPAAIAKAEAHFKSWERRMKAKRGA